MPRSEVLPKWITVIIFVNDKNNQDNFFHRFSKDDYRKTKCGLKVLDDHSCQTFTLRSAVEDGNYLYCPGCFPGGFKVSDDQRGTKILYNLVVRAKRKEVKHATHIPKKKTLGRTHDR